MSNENGQASRREFLKTSLLGAGAVAVGLYALREYQLSAKARQISELMGPLAPVADSTTGLPLLMLPPGFRYRSFSWVGETMDDGYSVPARADGMGVVEQSGPKITLVRNHELRGAIGAIGAAENAYDNTGGGTTTLVFDTDKESLTESWISLGGTLNNCAGGVTPWGTWLSCEEGPFSPALVELPVPFKQLHWKIEQAEREHGFVFEVPPRGVARPEPIKAMGQFYHEAAAVDPISGIVYMTEDSSPKAGFYRYIPEHPGELARGGALQMMRVIDRTDLRDDVALGQGMAVEWVDIDNPEAGFEPGSRDGAGVVSQGLRGGGSAFTSLEGCTFRDGHVIFTSKAGGNASAGYIFSYDPEAALLTLIYESPDHNIFSGPDNIIMSPRGSLLVCEDRMTNNLAGQSLAGLNTEGELFRFARINPELQARINGIDLRETAVISEWAGVTFSEDGEWLFANIYNPGITVAITGPWEQGLI